MSEVYHKNGYPSSFNLESAALSTYYCRDWEIAPTDGLLSIHQLALD
ncbi:MAG: hypothetical protein OXI67_08480 [Candidatus Poribacteria bacterium]|nr:hypothetical protein [Candidatus Poribacteria bacterium]